MNAPCSVAGCPSASVWTDPDTRVGYCEPHSREALMSEDREDFADEWAVDDRREREAS